METIALGYGVEIAESEFDFSFSRASGPGGQHVNRAETKVELRWDIAASPSLAEAQRARLLHGLERYLVGEGVLRLVSDETRSQRRNREIVILRLQSIARDALRPPRSRRATRPTRSARERAQESQRQHREKKRRRRKIDPNRY